MEKLTKFLMTPPVLSACKPDAKLVRQVCMTQNYFHPHKEWSFRDLSSRKTSDNACAGVGAGFMPSRTSAETRCAVCLRLEIPLLVFLEYRIYPF